MSQVCGGISININRCLFVVFGLITIVICSNIGIGVITGSNDNCGVCYAAWEWVTCPTCGGSGVDYSRPYPGGGGLYHDCSQCSGTGKIFKNTGSGSSQGSGSGSSQGSSSGSSQGSSSGSSQGSSISEGTADIGDNSGSSGSSSSAGNTPKNPSSDESSIPPYLTTHNTYSASFSTELWDSGIRIGKTVVYGALDAAVSLVNFIKNPSVKNGEKLVKDVSNKVYNGPENAVKNELDKKLMEKSVTYKDTKSYFQKLWEKWFPPSQAEKERQEELERNR